MNQHRDRFPTLFSESQLPSESRSLQKRVVHLLQEAIIIGELKPGDQLLETQIATQLGVSRGPVREALRDLVQQGLVESVPHKGTVVVDVSEDEVHGLLIPTRMVIEGFAYSQYHGTVTDEDFDHLHQFVDLMRSDDVAQIVSADVGFHEAILIRAGQPHALQLWRLILPRIRAYFHRHGRARDSSGFADEHLELLTALRHGTKTEMLAVLRTHLEVPRVNDDVPLEAD